MAKFYGPIGFAEKVETRPGVWEEKVTERNYYGDEIKSVRRTQSSNEVNDNIDISNQISILADPFANENFYKIRYVSYMGTDWKITSVEPRYPRLILTMGGLYNGKKA